ncbi:MAG: hypothetical protein IPG92_13620 [Flavobacteriales bacterium]|nr:hypothetical protein [Flavobacteriales bacterium]
MVAYFVTGYVGGIMDVDPGPANVSIISFGDPDIFLLKMSATDEFEWVKRITSTGEDRGWCVRTDAQGKDRAHRLHRRHLRCGSGAGHHHHHHQRLFDHYLGIQWSGRLPLGGLRGTGRLCEQPVRVDHFADGALHVHGCVADLQMDRDPSAAVDPLYTSDGLGAMNLKWGTCAAVVPTIAITASTNPFAQVIP